MDIEEGKVKKGRRKKGEVVKYEVNKEQTKFFVDLSKNQKDLREIQELLVKANNKDYGEEVLFKDLCLYAIAKLSNKDIERIQDNSLSEMEKVERSLCEYNTKNKLELSLGEYLLKKLNIN